MLSKSKTANLATQDEGDVRSEIMVGKTSSQSTETLASNPIIKDDADPVSKKIRVAEVSTLFPEKIPTNLIIKEDETKIDDMIQVVVKENHSPQSSENLEIDLTEGDVKKMVDVADVADVVDVKNSSPQSSTTLSFFNNETPSPNETTENDSKDIEVYLHLYFNYFLFKIHITVSILFFLGTIASRTIRA